MKNLNNYSINKKKVLFRADLNIPVINGKITDNSRIEAIKSSIKKLLKQQNKIFILDVQKKMIKISTHCNLFFLLFKRNLVLRKYIF